MNMFNEHVHCNVGVRVPGFAYVNGRGARVWGKTAMRRSIEKRYHDRIRPGNVQIEYRLMGCPTRNRADIINLSPGGLCFLRDTILHKGEQLLIQFPINSIAIMRAEVVRVDGREVAVRFIEYGEKIDKLMEAFAHY